MTDIRSRAHFKEDQFLAHVIARESGSFVKRPKQSPLDCFVGPAFGGSPRNDKVVSIDWDYLIEKAKSEGVFYPFYKNLISPDIACDTIPQEFRDKFRQMYLSHIAQSENFISQVTSLLDRLDALKIKILLFKGPTIDSLIYDGFYRPRIDLDIVVKDEDSLVVKKALADGDPLRAHIHSHLINNTWLSADNALAAVNMEKIWQETAMFKNYKNIFTLRPEMNILFLCEHAVKHDVDQLVFLYEIDRLIRFYGIRFDWRKFVALAEELGLGRIVYYGLYFTKEMLSGDIPDEILSRLKPENFTIGERSFIANTMNRKITRYSAYCVYLAARKGMMKKVRFLFKMAFSRLRRSVLS